MQTARPATLSKRDSNTGIFCECCLIFKNTYFEEHLRTVSGEILRIQYKYRKIENSKYEQIFINEV